MNAVQSESADRPLSLEITLRSVFTRTNIVEGTKEQDDGTVIPWFTYTENQYTPEEWKEVEKDEFDLDVDFRITMLELGV